MKALPYILGLLIVIGIAFWFFVLRDKPEDTDVDPGTVSIKHPPREFQPDWPSLEDYQGTITASELLDLLENVYTVGDTWRQVISIDDTTATIQTSGEPFVLKLRPEGEPEPEATNIRRYWGTGSLESLHIAIDPGHIGGKYAEVEKRQFGRPEDKPVREGEMTLLTAIRLKPLLEAMGAKVSLVRTKNEPVTKKRSKYYLKLYQDENPGVPKGLLMPWAEKRFYRRAEIVDRAKLVNEELKPDLVLCLHYNASGDSGAWLDPSKPILVPQNHFHILMNGAYTKGEVLNEGDRFQMMERILQRIHRREVEMAKVVADVFVEHTDLPAYSYDPNSSRAKNVGDHPYLWARNLLANRSFTCPVIYFEPWVMNNFDVFNRTQLGDYDGLKEVNGKQQPSLMRQYAEAVAAGIAKFYSDRNE